MKKSYTDEELVEAVKRHLQWGDWVDPYRVSGDSQWRFITRHGVVTPPRPPKREPRAPLIDSQKSFLTEAWAETRPETKWVRHPWKPRRLPSRRRHVRRR